MNRFILALFLQTSAYLFAQTPTIPERVQQLNTMAQDTNRVNLLNEISWEVKYSDPQTAGKFSKESAALAEKLRFYSGAGMAYKTLGILSDEQGKLSDAISNYEKASGFFRKAKDEMGMAKVQGNLGMIYRQMERYPEALAAFNTSLKVFEVEHFEPGMMLIYENIAICYNNTGDGKKALYAAKAAYAIMRKLNAEEPTVYGNLGTAYMACENYPEAEKYLKKAIEIIAASGERTSVSWLSNLGTVYSRQKKYDRAIPYFIQALENAPVVYESNNMKTEQSLAKAYAHVGNYEEAFHHIQKYAEIRDSVFSLQTSRQLSELTEKYQSEKKQLQIAALRKEGVAKNRIIRSEQMQKYIFAGSMLVFLALGLLLYRAFRQKQADNRIISEQKQLVEEKNREILDSITYAKRLQSAILPFDRRWKDLLPDSFILYKPKDIVAGDFYWLEEVRTAESELLLFAAADCTGHGVPGAMVSVVCSNALNRAVLEYGLTVPSLILDKTRELVVATFGQNQEEVKDGMDISLCCLNRKTLELSWAGANNPLWRIDTKGNFTEIKADKQPIGSFHRFQPFTNHALQLGTGDTLYLFSDGFADQFGGKDGKKFKSGQLKTLLTDLSGLSMEEQNKQLYLSFESWRGELEQIDDVCILGIRVQ